MIIHNWRTIKLYLQFFQCYKYRNIVSYVLMSPFTFQNCKHQRQVYDFFRDVSEKLRYSQEHKNKYRHHLIFSDDSFFASPKRNESKRWIALETSCTNEWLNKSFLNIWQQQTFFFLHLLICEEIRVYKIHIHIHGIQFIIYSNMIFIKFSFIV